MKLVVHDVSALLAVSEKTVNQWVVSAVIHGRLSLLSRLSVAGRQPEFRAAIARKAPCDKLSRLTEAIDRTVAVPYPPERGIPS